LFFEHGHTYAAYMLAAVAGLAATRELLTRDLPGNAKRMEGYLKEKLRALDSRFGVIGDIRGKGLMVAAELVADKATKLPFPVEIGKMVAKTSLKYGLLHRAGSHWISIAPPLIATKEDIDEIVIRLEKSLGDVMEAIS
jgi:adenosylmethionine-8-amino-7-oxononanoate aminotransferase